MSTPLETPELLESILKWVDSSRDLLNCAQVSIYWSEVALRVLWSASWVKNRDNSDRIDRFTDGLLDRIATIVTDCNTPTDRDYSRIWKYTTYVKRLHLAPSTSNIRAYAQVVQFLERAKPNDVKFPSLEWLKIDWVVHTELPDLLDQDSEGEGDDGPEEEQGEQDQDINDQQRDKMLLSSSISELGSIITKFGLTKILPSIIHSNIREVTIVTHERPWWPLAFVGTLDLIGERCTSLTAIFIEAGQPTLTAANVQMLAHGLNRFVFTKKSLESLNVEALAHLGADHYQSLSRLPLLRRLRLTRGSWVATTSTYRIAYPLSTDSAADPPSDGFPALEDCCVHLPLGQFHDFLALMSPDAPALRKLALHPFINEAYPDEGPFQLIPDSFDPRDLRELIVSAGPSHIGLSFHSIMDAVSRWNSLREFEVFSEFIFPVSDNEVIATVANLPRLEKLYFFWGSDRYYPADERPSIGCIRPIFAVCPSLKELSGSFDINPDKIIPADRYISKSIKSIDLQASYFLSYPSYNEVKEWTHLVFAHLSTLFPDDTKISIHIGIRRAKPESGAAITSFEGAILSSVPFNEHWDIIRELNRKREENLAMASGLSNSTEGLQVSG